MIRYFLIPGQNWTFAELCLHSSCHGCAELTRCAREHKRQRHFTHSCIYFVQLCWLMQDVIWNMMRNKIKCKKWENTMYIVWRYIHVTSWVIEKSYSKDAFHKKNILLIFCCCCSVCKKINKSDVFFYFCVQILFVVSVFWICGLDISIYLELWKSLQTVRGPCLGHRACRFVWVSWQRNHEREKRKEVCEHGLFL